MPVPLPPTKSPLKDEKEYYRFALRIVGDFGATLAIPVIIFVLAGQWLDEKYQTSPRFTILAFALAALTSAKIIYKKAKKYGQEYQELGKK